MPATCALRLVRPGRWRCTFKSPAYQPRTYRQHVRSRNLVAFRVVVRETDLYISATSKLREEANQLVLKYRAMLEKYIEEHPSFLTALQPLRVDESAPDIVKEMSAAATKVGVGPMAAVAGAIAEFVGNELLPYSPDIIIENGGDIFIKATEKRIVGIYAGDSPLTNKMGLEIEAGDTPLGVCTSSGTVGHSLSFGKTDATIVLSKSTSLADAAATAIGNMVVQPSDINKGLAFARSIDGLMGVVIIVGAEMGVWGNVKLCQL